jgi:hypothetical protein
VSQTKRKQRVYVFETPFCLKTTTIIIIIIIIIIIKAHPITGHEGPEE